MIKVSIIVPVYNVEKYIIRCLDSVINQTYPNIECILVDDCGYDSSITLLEQRLNGYLGCIEFKILHHEQNRGLSCARNTGTYASTGDYIYYLDSDDEILPSCIETLVALTEKYPEVEMIQGNTKTIPESSKKSDCRNILYKGFPEYVNDNNWIRKHFYCSRQFQIIPMNAWNKLIKKAFIKKYNYLFQEGIIHEDEIWMFLIVKNLKTIVFSMEYSYLHYVTDGSIMQSKSNYESIRSWGVILKEIFNNIDYPLYKHQKKKYIRVLYYNMRRMDLNIKEEKELYFAYKTFIKSLLRMKNGHNIFFIFALLILLMPQFFNNSFIGRILFHSFVVVYR
jgi:glycosyltransferase involved in cell wall biosynthesis